MFNNQVCLFFYARGKFLIYGCNLEDAERYGDFLIYPQSHFEIWEQYYYDEYGVDFDFFPRGRVAYNQKEDKFVLYYDACIGDGINDFVKENYDVQPIIAHDEHYQCHNCNKGYVV